MRLSVATGALALLALGGTANAADLYKQNGGAKDAVTGIAVSDPILAANNQAIIQFVTTNFDYMEKFAGGIPGFNACNPVDKCDSETGWVYGVGGEISVMQNVAGISNVYFDAQLSYVTGQTDYTGALTGTRTAGKYGSVTGKTGADVYDADFRFGKGFALSSALMATPYIGAGFHEWDRAVNTGEVYSHGYVGGGLLLQWAATDKLVFSANGLVGTTYASYITVNPIFSADLGDTMLYKVGGGIDYALTSNIHSSAKAEWTDFGYGRSAIVGGAFEPDSHTSNITVKAGVGYSWGGGYVPLK